MANSKKNVQDEKIGAVEKQPEIKAETAAAEPAAKVENIPAVKSETPIKPKKSAEENLLPKLKKTMLKLKKLPQPNPEKPKPQKRTSLLQPLPLRRQKKKLRQLKKTTLQRPKKNAEENLPPLNPRP